MSTDLAGARGRGAELAERAPAAVHRRNPRGQQSNAYLAPTSKAVTLGSYSNLPLTISYDADGMVTGATDGTSTLSAAYAGANSRLSNVAVGNAIESLSYDAFGTLANQTAACGAMPLLSLDTNSLTDPAVQRDVFGRIWKKKETTCSGGAATTHALVYTYDGLGQLSQVTQDGATVEQYTQDPNGNRLTELGATTPATAPKEPPPTSTTSLGTSPKSPFSSRDLAPSGNMDPLLSPSDSFSRSRTSVRVEFLYHCGSAQPQLER